MSTLFNPWQHFILSLRKKQPNQTSEPRSKINKENVWIYHNKINYEIVNVCYIYRRKVPRELYRVQYELYATP